MLKAVDQIGGAVHRIENPKRTAGVDGGVVSFLSKKLHGRGQLKEPVPEQALHGKIHVGDEIRRALGQDGLDGGGVGQ